MNAATQIATHLNILESAITRIEEWKNVLFVVAKGIGARFVSKKVVKKVEVNLEVIEKGYATEWMDTKTEYSCQIKVQKHCNGGGMFSASFKSGTSLEGVGKFESLESAVDAAWKARKAYLADRESKREMQDKAFAASVGRMQTSTGDWVTADEWDRIEGLN